MTFQIPLHFEDILRSAAGEWRVIPSEVQEIPLNQRIEIVETNLALVLSASSSSKSHFDILYTLISRYQNLSSEQRTGLVETVCNLTRTTETGNISHLKICLFFAAGLLVCASNVSPACKFWEKTGCESVLESILSCVTSISTPSSFSPSDLDQLSSILVRISLHVIEKPALSKSKHVRPLLASCLSKALQIDKRQYLPANAALLHALCRHEHIPTSLSDILLRICNETQELKPFVSEFICDIARLPDARLNQDVSAAKSISLFLSDFADKSPSIFAANIALVLSLLNVDSYIVRNGVTHVITALICENHNPDDPLLDILVKRAHYDAHAFTRSKALQCCITLVNKKAMPNRLFPILADLAASRLDDRTAAVRKYAAQLLSTLLRENPFGPALKLSHFNEKLDELNRNFPDGDIPKQRNSTSNSNSSRARKEIKSSDGEAIPDTGSEHEDNSTLVDGETASVCSEESSDGGETSFVVDNSTTETNANEDPSIENAERGQVRLQKFFYKTAVHFIQAAEAGLNTAYNMLRSKSITDIAEAVSLLVTAIQFQLEAATGCAVRKMLPLTLARENNVREKVVDAYVHLLAPGGLASIQEKEAAIVVAMGLTNLVIGATLGELACLKELLHALSSTRDECRVIIPSVVTVLWDLYAGRVPSVSVKQRRGAGVLVSMIGETNKTSVLSHIDVIEHIGLVDATLTRWSCVALSQLTDDLVNNHELCSKLRLLCTSSDDFSTVEQAINALYAISKDPETLFSSVLSELQKNLYKSDKIKVTDLSRFFVVVGHVAIKELVRIERLVLQLRKKVVNNGSDENNDEEEHANAKADAALKLAEKELVSPSSLIGRYGNVAKSVVSNLDAPEELRASAVLCLAKLMCVHEKFCENNLRLLFSVLVSEGQPLVRANAVTALGDLTFRFPNLIEPWLRRIYELLRDPDVKVRKNTLIILTHLILNDMIKVKGHIYRMALCILDEDERIAEMAQVFFQELSRKSANAIYNIFPDTISHLSRMDDVSSGNFKKVIAYLMSLMDKEKHADSMVDKLCHRFRTSESIQENRDLAYCISQLNISIKGVIKLSDNIKSYSTAIIDGPVHSYIMQAISKGNKDGAAGTSAQVVEELTVKIDAIRRAAGDEASDGGLDNGSMSTSHTSQSIVVSRKRRNERTVSSSIEEHQVDVQTDQESSEEASESQVTHNASSSSICDGRQLRSSAGGGKAKNARKREATQALDEESELSSKAESISEGESGAGSISDGESEASNSE